MDIRNTPPLPNAHHSSSHHALHGHTTSNAAANAAAATHMAAAMAAAQKHQFQQQLLLPPAMSSVSKYGQLLAVIEDMGKDIRPTYSGSKSSAERLKRGIVHARILVRECLMECERSART